jgi:hypothetical protein
MPGHHSQTKPGISASATDTDVCVRAGSWLKADIPCPVKYVAQVCKYG